MQGESRHRFSIPIAFVATALPLFFFHFLLKFGRLQNIENINALIFVDLYKSDVFFYFSFFFLGISALTFSRGRWQLITLFALQLIMVCLTLLEISAHNYFIKTGAHLSWHLLLYTLKNFSQVSHVMASETTASSQLMLLGAPAFVLLLPWLLTLLFEKIDFSRLGYALPRLRISTLGLFVICTACLVLPPFTSKDTLFAQNFVFNIISSYIETSFDKGQPRHQRWQHPVDATLVQKNTLKAGQAPNVVILVLESVRATATSLAEKYPTTPFLKKLADSSLHAEWAFSVIPHTSKCLVSIHCGIEPSTTMAIEESKPHGIPAKCLPLLLNEQGYRTVYFQSPWKWFENREGLVKNFGHNEFYSGESMSTEGFDEINYFGHEDRMMIKPSKNWLKRHLKKNPGQPFMVTYLTGSAHHYYGLPKNFKKEQYHHDAKFNRYLNTVKITDDFVREIFEQYKSLGLYENTVFIIVGDHGEGFGEHGVSGHSFVPYEESLRVPLLIHYPKRFKQGLKLTHFVQQQDILPTVIDILGFTIKNNHYRGINMLTPRSNRVFFASCWHENECLTRFEKDLKLVHYFNKKPDEAYFLDKDPFEKKNIIDQVSNRPALLKESLAWYRNLKQYYANYRDDQLSEAGQR